MIRKIAKAAGAASLVACVLAAPSIVRAPSAVAVASVDVEATALGQGTPVPDSQERDVAPGVPAYLTFSAADPNGDGMTFTVETGPEHGQLTVADELVGPAWSYTSDPGYLGEDSVVFRATDTTGESAVGTVTIHVRDDGVTDVRRAVRGGEYLIIDPFVTSAGPRGAIALFNRAGVGGIVVRPDDGSVPDHQLLGGLFDVELADAQPEASTGLDQLYLIVDGSLLPAGANPFLLDVVHDGVRCSTAAGPEHCSVQAAPWSGDDYFVQIQAAQVTGTWGVFAGKERVAPVTAIEHPRDGQIYLAGETGTFDFSCTDDGGSELASCEGSIDGEPVPSGTALPTNSPGVHDLRVAAADGAGNTAVTERHIAVVSTLSGAQAMTVTLPGDFFPVHITAVAVDCPTQDVCWIAGVRSSDEEGLLIKVEDGVAEAPIELPQLPGLSTAILALDCQTADRCSLGGWRNGAHSTPGYGGIVGTLHDGAVEIASVPPPAEDPAADPGPIPIAVACHGDRCLAVAWSWDGTRSGYVSFEGATVGTVHLPPTDPSGRVLGQSAWCGSAGCAIGAVKEGSPSHALVLPVSQTGFGTAIDLGPGLDVGPIVCSATDTCNVVVDISGGWAPTNTRLAKVRAGVVTTAAIPGAPASLDEGAATLRAMACPDSLEACLGVGDLARGTERRALAVPIVGGVPGAMQVVPGAASLVALSCSSASCAAGGVAQFTASDAIILPTDFVQVTGLEVPVTGDVVPPTAHLISPADGGQYLLGEPVPVSFDCTDVGGSGLASCTASAVPGGPVASGEMLPTGAVGDHVLTVTAIDGAGNRSSDEIAYQVRPATVSAPVPENGGQVTTDPESVGASPEVPVQTALVVPAGLSSPEPITVEPVAAPPAPQGFVLYGQQLAIDAPASTPEDPYEVTFTIDGSLVGSTAPEDLAVFRDGIQALPCDPDEPVAAVPDPCIESAVRAPGSDDVLVTVRTAHFSGWYFGSRVAPTAHDDGYSTYQGQALVVPAPGLLANDELVTSEGAPAARVDVDGSTGLHGTLAMDGDGGGGFTYTPEPGFHGTVSFTYHASQGHGAEFESNTATVEIVVQEVRATALQTKGMVLRAGGGPILGRSLQLFVGTARLTSMGPDGPEPVAGAMVRFQALGVVLCSAVTDADGWASCGSSWPGYVFATAGLGAQAYYFGAPGLMPTMAKVPLIT